MIPESGKQDNQAIVSNTHTPVNICPHCNGSGCYTVLCSECGGDGVVKETLTENDIYNIILEAQQYLETSSAYQIQIVNSHRLHIAERIYKELKRKGIL